MKLGRVLDADMVTISNINFLDLNCIDIAELNTFSLQLPL